MLNEGRPNFMSKITVEAVENGYIVTLHGLTGKTLVYPKIEDVLKEVYQSVAKEWNVGDTITVTRD